MVASSPFRESRRPSRRTRAHGARESQPHGAGQNKGHRPQGCPTRPVGSRSTFVPETSSPLDLNHGEDRYVHESDRYAEEEEDSLLWLLELIVPKIALDQTYRS